MILQQLNHKHILVTASGLKNPPRTTVLVENWLKELVELVGMNVLMGPYSIRCEDVGNEGVTGIVVISTSHASAHFWDTNREPFVKMDLYSCKEFDSDVVINHFRRFDPSFIDWMVIDRNDTHDRMKIIERNHLFTRGLIKDTILYWLNSWRFKWRR